MTRILASMTQQHEPWLSLLAVSLCLLGAFVTMSLLQRAQGGVLRRTYPWLLAAALAAALTVWTSHFLDMLAYHSGVPAGHAPTPTGLSFLAVLVLCLLAFALNLRRGLWGIAGGVILGGAVITMHALGMVAYRPQGFVNWDADTVLAGVTVAMVAAVAASRIVRPGGGLASLLTAAGLFALSIAGLHVILLSALTVTPSPLFETTAVAATPAWLSIALALSTVLLVALAAIGPVLDRLVGNFRREEGARLQALTRTAFEGVVIHHGGRILDVNPAFCSLVGHAEEDLVSTNLIDLATGRARERASYAFSAAPEEQHEIELRAADGGAVPVEVMTRAIEFQDAPAHLVIFRDISERRAAEARIRYLANHDSLTGLPNRALFSDRLERALGRAEGSGDSVALFAIDLDRFKLINDAHGHMTGDRILTTVAERLSTVTSASDTAARLGGDEYGVILGGLKDPAVAVQRAAQLFQVACGINPVSIGVALYPSDADNAEDLIRRADLALARVKSEGGNGYGLYEPSLDEAVRTRRRLENELRWGIDSGHLQNFYQPQVDTHSGRLVGFEALVRWIDPERGIIPPGEFITLAEQTGLISKIGDIVLANACAAAAAWPGNLRVAVNLSPVQFTDAGLPERISEVLAETGLAPERLEIEVTEGVLIDDDEGAGEILTRLKQLGIRISMDDFGTGYSSMSYLRRFPFDKIKIDRSFVRDVHLVRENMAIVRATLTLARDLGIGVTAEGVETSEELLALREVDCPEVQGFLIGRPMRTEDADAIAESGVIDLLSRRRKADARLVA